MSKLNFQEMLSHEGHPKIIQLLIETLLAPTLTQTDLGWQQT
jgi:hypothetical protein